MNPAEDFAPDRPDPAFADDLRRDLELDLLWDAMGGGDPFLRAVARAGVLHPVTDIGVVRYRQEALRDCSAHPDDVAALYALAIDALSVERGILMMPVHGHPEMELSRAVRMLTALADRVERLRDLCAQVAPSFSSAAFLELFAVVAAELDDEYLRRLRSQLKDLSFTSGMLMSAAVGTDGQVTGLVLRRGKRENRGLLDRTPLKRPMFSFSIPERDEAGFTALGELRARSVADVADAASQSADHVMAFFRTLRVELAFYLAAQNLQCALAGLRAPTCVPDLREEYGCLATGLYDPCLALRSMSAPIGNDLELGEGRLLVITGANHGGKSTFLRALGVAQLMAQAGLPVAGSRFTTTPVGRVLTHWTREEDENLRHGKLDEELDRMSTVVDNIQPGDLLLCNESFASTNEAEGSQIAFDVASALAHAGVRVHYVTHMYDFARAVEESDLAAEFLRAPRHLDGGRSYRLEAGPPLRTSFGVDLYDRVFGTSLAGRMPHGACVERGGAPMDGMVDAEQTSKSVILVGIGPGMSDSVLTEAAHIARDLGAVLVCAHVDLSRYAVAERPDGTVDSRPLDPDVDEWAEGDFDGELAAHLDDVLADTGVEWTGRELAGDPAHALGRLADTVHARLIVVGTHEPGLRGGLREFFQGSVATHLAHRQHRPVLVVPLSPVTDGGPLPWE